MFVSAQWYAKHPRAGAIYLGLWSFHWAMRDSFKWEGDRLVHLYQRPNRAIIVYRGLANILELRLWPLYDHCEHGFHKKMAWWHRCDLVSLENPKGRPPDDELWDENSEPISSFRGRA